MSARNPYLDLDLDGVQLVEASAGTGKTWTIAVLYLRLIIEHGLRPEAIVVSTFTDAAAAELRERIFSRIKAEWALTRKHLLAILEQDDFLADNPMLKRSLQLRSPYMDPLNHLQVELLKRHRAGATDERLARGIHLSINGVASGLRNSG